MYVMALLVVGALVFLLGVVVDSLFDHGRLMAALVIVGTVIAANTACYHLFPEKPKPTAIDAARSLGMIEGQAYPIQVGRVISGTQGSGYITGSAFGVAGGLSMTPSSTMTVRFNQDDKSYLLEIPFKDVTVVEKQSGQPTAQFYLRSTGSSDEYGQNTFACKPQFVSIVLTQKCESTGFEPHPDVVRRGLSPIVSDSFDSATLELPSDLYAKLLGTPNPS